MSWKNLEDSALELATIGLKRFEIDVAYLATVVQDGVPRVHPERPYGGSSVVFGTCR
ncbi:MAG: hypothetical protein M1281_01025 [Chloroflexi bacterium]|nr:hypothetical protein [Chloroflexota bacterium]